LAPITARAIDIHSDGKRTAGPLQAALYGGVAISSIGLHHDFGTGSITNQRGRSG
jgi:hypothetical protein